MCTCVYFDIGIKHSVTAWLGLPYLGSCSYISKPLSIPAGTSGNFSVTENSHGDVCAYTWTDKVLTEVYVSAQAYIQSPISQTVKGEKSRGLSARHPSKCLMNHLSLSPSLSGSSASLTLLFSPNPSSTFSHFILVCLSLSLFLQANRRQRVALVRDEVWMLTRNEKRGRRTRRKANLHPMSKLNLPLAWIQTCQIYHLF